MPDTQLTESEILESLKGVTDPEFGQTLAHLGMLKRATLKDNASVQVEVELATPAYPNRERITEGVRAAIAQKLPQIETVDVAFSHTVKGNESGGRIGLRVKNVVAVGSGKGGVGKSTIAATMAFGLKSYGAKVGLMDADVYGPSIPHLVGAKGEPAMQERRGDDGQVINRIQPIEHEGLKLLSIGFMIAEDQAVI